MREPFTNTLSKDENTKTERLPNLQTWDRGDTATPYEPRLDGYLVRKAIGNGGMGWVYEAYDPALARLVAVKVMTVRSHLPELRARFAQEARILARLNHPNIVPVYHVGETSDGRLYYAMKLVPTGTLAEMMDALRKDTRLAVRVLVRIARAVQHLHENGIWHRDLKPSNVLMDEAGEPLVADFGVAKWCDGDESTVGFMRVGTFAYMAPEVVTHGSMASGPASDIWSLGVMAYELLGGRRPFAGNNTDPALPNRVCHEEPSPLRTHPDAAAGLDDGLERIVSAALLKDPAERYATAGQLADDLENWLNGRVVRGAKRAKPRNRRRWVVAAAAVLAVVALAAAGVPKLFKEKPTDPVKTLAEMLESDGKVVIVDDRGNMRVPVRPLDPNAPMPMTHTDGYLSVGSANTYLAEIWDRPLAHKVRVSADVEMLNGNTLPQVGIYARRGTRPGKPNTGPIHVMVTNGFTDNPVGLAGKRQFGEAYFQLSLSYTGDPTSQLTRASGDAIDIVRPGGPGTSRHLSIVIEPVTNGVTAMIDTHAYNTNLTARFELRAPEAFLGMNLPAEGPLLGDGFGLFAHRASAAFRNVVVERIDP